MQKLFFFFKKLLIGQESWKQKLSFQKRFLSCIIKMKKFLLITLISSLHDGMPRAGHFIKINGVVLDINLHIIFFKSWNCWNSLHCLKPLASKTWLPVTEGCLQSSTEAYLLKLDKDCDDINMGFLWNNLMEKVLPHLSTLCFVLSCMECRP